jgi:hypothetical protein
VSGIHGDGMGELAEKLIDCAKVQTELQYFMGLLSDSSSETGFGHGKRPQNCFFPVAILRKSHRSCTHGKAKRGKVVTCKCNCE